MSIHNKSPPLKERICRRYACYRCSMAPAVVHLLHSIILVMFMSSCTITMATAIQPMNRSEMDRQALLSFKSGISSDPLGVLRSWRKGSLHFCSWRGVTCGRDLPPRVVSLELNSAQLTGQLSPFIANLTSLARLNLEDNSLSGGIPLELGTSRSLSVVNLAYNYLFGGIPQELGTSRSLSVVNLAYNYLFGGIPQELGTSRSLSIVNLAYNSLSGGIPQELGTSRSLSIVNLAYNSLSGGIPQVLGTSRSLSVVNLAYNSLNGSIPRSLASSSSLTVLNLTSNSFSGVLPANLFNASSGLVEVDLESNSFTGHIPYFHEMTALRILNLADNNFSGSIPPSIGNVSSLTIVSLGLNMLTGSIPETLGHIQNLSMLLLYDNLLSGYVPTMLYNISSLTLLSLGQNNFIGQMPSGIGYSLPNLEILYMSGNNFEGFIPASLANASNLGWVNLENNSFSGPVPSLGSSLALYALYLGNNNLVSEDWTFLTSLSNCSGLQRVKMDGNTLNGSLPMSVGNLSSNLELLDFGKNQIVGPIPVSIANLEGLVVLKLGENKLSGQIPSAIGNLANLTWLSLDNNNLSGNIPPSLGNCQRLLMLNLSKNTLDGSIPNQLLNATSLSLGLDLSNNLFTGLIPEEIGVLINLVLLDVSSNNLSGGIPSSLARCLALSRIDLSENNFVGQIPEFLANFGLLEHLDLSSNDFRGPIPTSGVFENSSAVTLYGNTGLCTSSGSTFISDFPSCPATPTTETERKKNAHLLVIVIPAIAIALFSSLCVMVTLIKRSQAHKTRCTPCYKETRKKVSNVDILRATNWFSPINRIGSSQTASVYIGRFEFDTDLVAIKLFHLDEHGAYDSFLTECEVHRNTRHRNLVKAVTVCSTVDLENKELKAIVFEFMANGSLDMWVHPKLHQNSPKRGLSLGQMMRIAMDVASALDYMHNQITPPLIHCDVKPSNVLLDYDMTARLGDFGSAKFLSSSFGGPEGLPLTVGGTIGYIAPEYGMGFKISTGCDVYSFGVMVLEMLTGKRPTDEMFTDGLSLHKVVSLAFPDRLEEVLDPNINMPRQEHQALVQSCVVPLVEVGLLCSMESPKDRPGMREVFANIFAINEPFLESL